MNYESPKSLCWSVGTDLRQAIFETKLQREVLKEVCVEENWENREIKKTKGEGNVAEKKRKKKKGVVLVRRQKISLPHMYTLTRSKN